MGFDEGCVRVCVCVFFFFFFLRAWLMCCEGLRKAPELVRSCCLSVQGVVASLGSTDKGPN